MKINPSALLVSCASLFMLTGNANAACSRDMPEQLYMDCLVVEGAGSRYPNNTYAYKDEYEAWRNGQAQQDTLPAENGSPDNMAVSQPQANSMPVSFTK